MILVDRGQEHDKMNGHHYINGNHKACTDTECNKVLSSDINHRKADEKSQPKGVVVDEAHVRCKDGWGWEGARVTVGTRKGPVTKRKRDSEGELIGTPDPNPLVDSTLFEVAFDDGIVEELTAKVICDHVYAKVDGDGFEWLDLGEILEHYPVHNTGEPRDISRYKFLVRWKDDSESVVNGIDLKESHPDALANYSVDSGISNDPAFAWWVPYTIKKANRIIKKVKARNIRHEKYGIKIPRNTNEAYRFDQESNTIYVLARCNQ